jgi:hypothetical protein
MELMHAARVKNPRGAIGNGPSTPGPAAPRDAAGSGERTLFSKRLYSRRAGTKIHRAVGVTIMDWDVTQVHVVDDHTLHVSFRDGVAGVVHFEATFFNGVFEPLRNSAQFRTVKVVDGFVTWTGNLDLAPDAMHDEIKTNKEMTLR